MPPLADRHLRAQVEHNYRDFDVRGGRVLDAGAHKGYATQLFLDREAQFVRAVEPHPGNCKVWHENIDSEDAWLLQGALVADERQIVPLYLSGIPGSQSHSTATGKGIEIKVHAYPLHAAVREMTHVKMDVEGAEYELLAEPLPDDVIWLALEVHVRRPEWRAQAPWLIRHLEAQGFEWIVPPQLDLPRTRWGFDILGRR